MLLLLENTICILETHSLELKEWEFPLPWQARKGGNYARGGNVKTKLRNLKQPSSSYGWEGFELHFLKLPTPASM